LLPDRQPAGRINALAGFAALGVSVMVCSAMAVVRL
jgi:hypothetical protein